MFNPYFKINNGSKLFVLFYNNNKRKLLQLAKHVRAMLLPGGLKENKGDKKFNALSDPETDKLVPKFTDPIMLYCILPGNIHYINIRSPGKCVTSDIQKAETHAVCVTYNQWRLF